MSVRACQREIDSLEFCYWKAYYQLEPFGELVADQRHGIATSVHANINRDSKKRPDPYKPEDFIYWHHSHREPPAPIDPEQQAARIKELLFGASKNVA